MSEFPNDTLKDLVKEKAHTEFSIIACSVLALMSCLSIYFGASKSISSVRKNKEKHREAEFKSPTDAFKSCLKTSCVYVIIYIFPKLLSNVYINFLLKLLITIDGVIHLKCLFRPLVSKLVPESHRVHFYGIINVSVKANDIISFGICSIIGGVYFWNNHWLLSNIFGITFSIEFIKSMHLNNIPVACTFLGLELILDVVCVFMSDVMITIANSFKGPIMLVFPKQILHNWENGNEFSKLGLGDVTLPGCLIALLLRFDKSLNRDEKLYFHSGLVRYNVGYVVTVAMAFTFEHGQPALLYLVPACISIPCLVAVIKGDIEALLTYRWWDIAYSFLIGGDGRVYEAVGWKNAAEHTVNYNTISIGVAFMGTFNNVTPSKGMLDACQNLIACGIAKGYLTPIVQVSGHRDVTCTRSPGDRLYAIIKEWPNFKGGKLPFYYCNSTTLSPIED